MKIEKKTFQEFLNGGKLTREFQILKGICAEQKVGRKGMKRVMSFKLPRYAVLKDGHKGAIDVFVMKPCEGDMLTITQEEFDKACELMDGVAKRFNAEMEKRGIDSYAKVMHRKSDGKSAGISIRYNHVEIV